MSITIKELARLAGVSRTAVSLTINGKAEGRVSPEKREEIKTLVAAHRFRPNAAAQGLRGSSRYLIGVVMTAPRSPSFSNMVTLLQRKLRERGYMTLFSFWDELSEAPLAYETVLAHNIDGIIAWENPFAEQYSHVPTVMFYGHPEQPFSNVTLNDEAAICRAIDHFELLGHREIGFCGLENDLRIKYFLQELKKRGLPVQREWQLALPQESNNRIFEEFAAMEERPSALLVLPDYMACSLIRLAERRSICAGKDFSVLDLNNDPTSCWGGMPVSTLRISRELIVDSLINLLFKQIKNPGDKPVTQVLEWELIDQGTTGAFRAGSAWNQKGKLSS